MSATRHAQWLVSLSLGLLVLSGSEAAAQIDTGAIVGTVRDSSGAVLPGVTVTVTLDAAGLTQTTVTNDAGQYVFPSLRVGTYTVAAELVGFKRGVLREVQLRVQDRRDVGFVLELGAVTEVVTVRGSTQSLQLHSADIGNVVDERQLRELPLLGRRYSELAFLTPGVVQAPAGITSRGEDTFFNANGNYATWNNYTLDGADNNSFSTNLQERSPQVVQPPVDALSEFKVQTRTYSAEFGKAAGAVINASIKGGTNLYRGSAYGFFRDEAFNANTWENEQAGVAKGKFDEQIFGFTLGGPIIRNRFFFFGDYQATRTERALTQTASVPTALMRTGNLSELTGNMVATNAFVPAGCINATAKTVNPACFDPVAVRMLNLYPLPNVPGTGFFSNNFLSNGLLNSDIDQFDTRADYTLNAANSMFARYSFQNTHRLEPPVLEDPVASGDFSSDILIRGQNLVAGWSRIFGSTTFNEFRVAYNRVRSDSVHPAFGVDANSQFGILGVPKDPRFFGGLPHTTIARLTRIGGPFFRPQFQTSQVFQFSDNLTWTRGTHFFKVGGEFRRDRVRYIDLRSLNGEIGFNDGRYTGFGVADFLLGLATTQRLTLFHEPDLYLNGWQVYGQDSWRLASSFTFNYGFRYEYFTPFFDTNDRLTNIDPATGAVVRASASGSVFERTLIHPDRNDFAPRVSFAWTTHPRVVWRGGYGIFYQQTDRYGSESQLGLNLPQLVDASITANSAADQPAMILRQGFTTLTPNAVPISIVQWRIQDPNQKTPIVHQFSLGPEYQLSGNTVVAVEYVGNAVRNGRRLRNLNQGRLLNPGSAGVVFPYAQFGYGNAFLEQIVTNGRTDYHSLQFRGQRRLTGGLAYTLAYTFSNALGDFLDHLSAGGGASGNFPQNTYDMASDYGPLPFDIRHRFVGSFVYELPWGPGRAVTDAGPLAPIINNWSVNGILTLNSGRPFTAGANNQSATGAGSNFRANCIGDPLPSGFTQTRDRWFDTSAFAQPAAFTFGNCGYNTLRGPSFKTMNLSVFRNFPFGDRRVEFRLEVFNLFNWTNFAFPGSSVANLNAFGRITSSLRDPREMQMAVKFYF
ncbi:MAG: carboxypeptidase regulatory-like domain-containing protein [Acidobacteriota bacterium]